MTVPLSLLKSEVISFNPPLPTKKTDAIKRLGAGLIEKVRRMPRDSILVGVAKPQRGRRSEA